MFSPLGQIDIADNPGLSTVPGIEKSPVVVSRMIFPDLFTRYALQAFVGLWVGPAEFFMVCLH